MDYLEAIRRESDLFYAVADDADPTLGVPGCPGWDIADLVRHLGEVHWFWGTDIELRASAPDVVEADKPTPPDDYREAVAWGRAQADRMIDILDRTDDATEVWTWSPPHQTVGFIRRHQVQEAAVHRWDMQSAATTATPDPIDPEAASDAIDEVLAVTLPWSVDRDRPLPASIHLHCTDVDGEWFIHPDGRIEPIHAKGDVALRGTASDLLLVLFERLGVDALDVFGNEPLARQLVQRISTD